ncbi:MAG: HEAT repeat domain-containing protein [Candidatus Latescibacteria bacterium]|nr:HEAT repeat domain-containing protein [Candidatus Latescibacterota bacterium]
MALSNRLERARLAVFPVQPGEYGPLLLGLVTYFFIIGGVILGRNARDSLFLNSGLDVRVWLPWMYVFNAFAVVGCSAIYGAFIDRLDRRVFVTITTLLFAGSLLGSRVVIESQIRWCYAALYVLAQIIWLLSVMQFWTFAGDLFDSRQVKRLFPVINVGGLLGMVAAGFGGRPLIAAIGTANLLLVWAGLLGLSLVLLIRMRRSFPAARPVRLARDQEKPSAGQLFREGMGAVRAMPLMRLLASLTLAQWIVFTLVDYIFNKTVKATYPQTDELTAFLGVFRGWAGVSALLLQLFVTAPLIRAFGVGRTMLCHPGFMVLSTVGASWSLTFWSACAAKFGDHVLLYTIQDSSYQLLYNPIPLGRRGRLRAFVEGSLKPISMGLSGLILVVAAAIFRSVEPLAYIALGLSVLWAVIAARTGPAYLSALVAGLRSPDEGAKARAAQSLRHIHPEESQAVLVEGVQNPDTKMAVFSLELLRELPVPAARPAILTALQRPEAEVRAAAVETLTDIVPHEAFPVLERAIADESPVVRAAAARSMGKLSDERAADLLERAVDDEDAKVQEAALVALTQTGGLDGILVAVERLKTMLASSKTAHRRVAARTLGALRARSMTLPLLRLLDDPEPRVQAEAVEALGKLHDIRAIQSLIQAMAVRPLHRKARRAITATLKRHADRVAPVLLTAARNPALQPIWPDLLDLIGWVDWEGQTTEVEAFYLNHLRGPNLRLRHAALEGLESLVVRTRQSAFLAPPLLEHAAGELAMLYDNLRGLDVLRQAHGAAAAPVITFIEDENRFIQWELFRILGLLSDPGLLRTISHRLFGDDPRQRADAVEALDNLTFKEIVSPLVPTLDPQTIRTALLTDTRPAPSVEAFLRTLAGHPSPAVRAMTMHWLPNSYPELARHFIEVLRHDIDPTVQDAVRRAGRRLSGEPVMESPMISIIERILYLKTLPMFAHLDADQLRLLAEVVVEENLPATTVIFEQGDAPGSLYMVVRGMVAINRVVGGQTRTLGTYGGSTYFGEMAFLDGQPRSGTAVTSEPTILLSLSRDAFKDVIKDEPEIAFGIFSELTNLLRRSYQQIEEIGLTETTPQEYTPTAMMRA